MPTRYSGGSSLDEATKASLCALLSSDDDSTNRSQLQHRLNILGAWFGDLSSASTILSNSTVLEIGPGQGDSTVPLAYFARKVYAVDNAPMTYGSPFTLAQAQKRINESEVGPSIQWVQSDIIEYIQTSDASPDFIVLAHFIFYVTSEQYLSELLRALRSLVASCKNRKTTTRLLIAEWGMRASTLGGEAHILAAKAQATNPITDGNVRTIVTPERIKELAIEASWRMERESWIESPNLEDGQWDVELARTMAYEEKVILVGKELQEMERVVEELHGGEIRCMDVWTSVFTL
ncbi:MAG: hypothetical protein M1828_003437 [Chrysothrix sp. TS-e1954]|nr:MAG: hypothetical protein M1828_003437 [Chrysothrix sp. TS-e1954]